jgi:hypothetical protein
MNKLLDSALSDTTLKHIGQAGYVKISTALRTEKETCAY